MIFISDIAQMNIILKWTCGECTGKLELGASQNVYLHSWYKVEHWACNTKVMLYIIVN